VLVFGSLSIWLQNDMFIKMKPTIIYALFAVVLFGGLAFGRSLLGYVLDSAFHLDAEGWRKLTFRWALFFVFSAVLNEVVWRSLAVVYPPEQADYYWAGFKLFGFSALTFVFILTQMPLTDETEMFGLSHVRRSNREAEHAAGWSLDASHVGGALELRGAAYRTVISHPLILRTLGEELQLVNADESTRIMGLDVSARYRLRPLRFTASYSYMDGNRPEIGQLFGEDFEVDTTMRRPMLLNPRHSATVELAHERENNRVIGVSARFVGREELRDTLYSGSRPYVTLDARLEKHVGPAIVFAVAKNVTGGKQSQFFPVLLTASGPAGQWTRDTWGPLDGFALNVGLRLKY